MTPPLGTTIRVEDEWGTPKLVLPHKASPMRYLFTLASIAVLCAWALIWTSLTNEVVNNTEWFEGFLVVWLCAWTLVGILHLYTLYRLYAAGAPETFTFALPNLQYDSGTPPVKLLIGFGFRPQTEYFKSLVAKRKQFTITQGELASLRLREHESGNRLTVDCGGQRIELGASLSEIEREWLFKTLAAHYGLPEEKNKSEGIPAGTYI
ncbi:MAG: hypothetical protein L6R28_04715 [Planctomycetes bacterium]|nr:hypothetical protein [Planctomycetota bacterium]